MPKMPAQSVRSKYARTRMLDARARELRQRYPELSYQASYSMAVEDLDAAAQAAVHTPKADTESSRTLLSEAGALDA